MCNPSVFKELRLTLSLRNEGLQVGLRFIVFGDSSTLSAHTTLAKWCWRRVGGGAGWCSVVWCGVLCGVVCGGVKNNHTHIVAHPHLSTFSLRTGVRPWEKNKGSQTFTS